MRKIKKSPPIESGGWISPDGSFYPCGFFEHDFVAEQLDYMFYKTLDGVNTLINKGWLHVTENGLVNINHHKGEITQKQIDMMSDLYNVAKEEEYKRYMQYSLKKAIEKKDETAS